MDYIGGKLDELGYKNIVVFGTSALQSFYLDKVIELAKENGTEEEPFVDSSVVKDLRRNYRDADDYIKSSIMFIKSAIDNLDEFHNILDATEKEIETFSGIPQLRRYTKYIGESKADMEIVNKVVGDCEGQFAIIRSALDVVEYQTLSEEAKKYLRKVANRIDEVYEMSKNITRRMEVLTQDRNRRNARRQAKDLTNQVRVDTIKMFNEGVDFNIERFSITEENIRELANDSSKTGFMSRLAKDISSAFNRAKEEAVDDCRKIVRTLSEEKRDEIKNTLTVVTEEIIEKVRDINSTLQKSGVPTITLPDFPVSVSMSVKSTNNISGSIDPNIALKFAKEAIKVVERTGFFGWIADIFSTKTEVDIAEFKKNIADVVKSEGREKLNSEFENLSRQVEEGIDDIFDKFMDDCDDTSTIYQKIFENTHRNIVEVLDETGKKKAELERNIATLEEISGRLQPYFTIWNDIRGGK